MGASDMMGDGFNPDAARYDRMNRTQPAPFAPGQDAVFQQQNVFPQSSVPNNTAAMGDVFSTGITGGVAGSGGVDPMNPFNASVGAGVGTGVVDPMNPFGAQGFNGASPNSLNPSFQQAQPEDPADKFWKAVGTFFKGATAFFKDLSEANKQLTVRWYSEWGKTITFTGLALAGIGIVLKLFGVSFGFSITAGGLLCVGSGACIWLMLTEKARSVTSKYKDVDNQVPAVSTPQPEPVAFDFSDSGGSTDFFNESPDLFGDSPESSDDWGDDPYGDDPYAALDTNDEPQAGMSTEEALKTLPEVNKGMFTRDYLWEMFTKVLPTMHPGFAEMREIPQDDDVFLRWDDMLRESASVAGCKEDFLPDLEQLQENMFVIIATCNRPAGFKPEAVAAELANIYAYSSGEKNENVFAKVDTIGARCRITIFNGAAAMISLKDMMLQVKDWICDTKNYMPVVLGIDQLGHVITVDCKKLESIIVTGMPRSGKSWFVQSMITQMCAFTPPSELNIYICDPKGGGKTGLEESISDFRDFTLPHVKKNVSDDAEIVRTLNYLVKKEAPRRKKIIGGAGFVNIWDFKEKHPDVHLPIIYVIIDEVVTLASRMDKETNQEFRMLLRELISQLPALGIRAFMIPHVLNNDIIEKKTSDLVPCKISVCGDADHIEKATGSKPKEFPYRLVNKGDMAVRLTGFSNTLYVHGPALTSSNVGNSDVFSYLRRVWTKLEPEEATGGISAEAEKREASQKLLDEVGDMTAASQDVSNHIEWGKTPAEESGLDYSDVAGDDDFQLF